MNRRQAREAAFVIIFQRSFTQDDLDTILENAGPEIALDENDFTYQLAKATFDHLEEIDQVIERYSHNWKISRISKAALAALRLAVCEMRYRPEIPYSVSINEAVDLAKTYGGEDDFSFVNGLLGAYAKDCPEKQAE